MAHKILIYAIILVIACIIARRNHNAVKSVSAELKELQANMDSRLSVLQEGVINALELRSREISEALRNNDNSMKRVVSQKNDEVTQILLDEFSKQTVKYIEEAENSYRALMDLGGKIQDFQARMIEKNKENSKQLEDTGKSFTLAVSDAESNIKEYIQRYTEMRFDTMGVQLADFKVSLEQMVALHDDFQESSKRMFEEESAIIRQEASVAEMVSGFSRIVELTSEMNNTSKEIFEFMKLYLVQSALDNISNRF